LKAPRLSTLLTWAFAGLFWTAVLAFALVLRFGIEANFQTYLDTAQAAAHARIMGTLSGLNPGATGWDRTQIAELGRQALDEGLVVSVRDDQGNVVWDARVAETSRVAQVFQDLQRRLQARTPWEHGWWESSDHPFRTGAGGGTMSVDLFEPRRLGASDLAFLEGIDGLLLVLAAAGLVLSALLGSLTARVVVRPLVRVQHALDRLAGGNDAPEIPVSTVYAEGRDLEARMATVATRLARLQALRETAGADTAHELRTPLANLAAQLEALEDGVLEAGPLRYAALGSEVKRLLALVEAWEDLERARSRTAAPGRCVDPRSVVLQAAEAFRTRMAEKNQILEVLAEEGLGPLPLDGMSLGRIVVNLVENAHRYAPSGGKVAIAFGRDGDGTTLVVDDDGPGIPPEQRDLVFDRFYRVDPSRTRDSGGLGLGLSLVKALVEGAGGSVKAQASPWGGCRIRVSFPRVPS
jgi:signal transduction histidine kinase